MRNIQANMVEKIKTNFMFKWFLRKLCHLWDNVETLWYIYRCHKRQCNMVHGLPFWVTKAIDIHSEYVILIAFLRRQCLRKRASLLRL